MIFVSSLSWTKNKLRTLTVRGYDSTRCLAVPAFSQDARGQRTTRPAVAFEEEERQLAAVWAHMKMCALFFFRHVFCFANMFRTVRKSVRCAGFVFDESGRQQRLMLEFKVKCSIGEIVLR